MADDTMNGEVRSHGDNPRGPYIRVNRPAYLLGAFRDKYQKPAEPPKPLLVSAKEKASKALTCDKTKVKKTFMSIFPFIRIMRKYSWRDDLVNDIISGLTVGIMQLPQGMAYAMLADLPPVVGLYMSFFPAITYFFFGTSRQVSIGTVAVISLMTGTIVARETDIWKASRAQGSVVEATTMASVASTMMESLLASENTTAGGASSLSEAEETAYRIQIATSAAFICGLAQIAMGLCRVGFLTTYMGDSLVSGFTTGAAVHVFTSQVKTVLGLKIPRYDNLFQVINTYGAIFNTITKTKIAEPVITLICIVILYTVKDQINPRIKNKCRIPIPIELIVVVAGTLASYYVGFRARWGVQTVGNIPAGMPQPSFPTMVNVNNYGFDCVVIGIVAFAQSVSLAVLMAKKHHYDIDANNELFGYGASTFVGSFLSCYPIAASVSRSSVQDSAGGRTQLASLFSATLVLIVILFIGPLFKELPNCCLSAVIIVALRSMLLQVLELRRMYKISPYDCAIWVVTFLCVVILSVEMGLYIGIVFAFFTVVTRSQMASVKTLENVADNDQYRLTEIYTCKARQRPGIRVVAYNTPLYYANGELFLKQIFRATGVKPERMRKILKRMQMNTPLRNVQDMIVDESMVVELETVGPTANGAASKKEADDATGTADPKDPRPFRHLVIDCTSMAFVDPQGIKTLKQLIDEYKNVGITVYLGGVRDEVYRTMQQAEFLKKYQSNVYLTVCDAVETAEHALQKAVPDPSEMKHTAPNADPGASVEDKLLIVDTGI